MLLPGLHENVESSVDRISSLFKFRPIVSPLAQRRKREAEEPGARTAGTGCASATVARLPINLPLVGLVLGDVAEKIQLIAERQGWIGSMAEQRDLACALLEEQPTRCCVEIPSWEHRRRITRGTNFEEGHR